tara:strand:+ start:1222 stop:1800 length:579 start_codon:yes stop_codon:yes gene_type:complete
MLQTKFIQIKDLPESLNQNIITEFINQYVINHKESFTILKNLSNLYVYILSKNDLNKEYQLNTHQNYFIKKNEYIIAGFILFHDNLDLHDNYVEANSLIQLYGSRILNNSLVLSMINEFESIVKTPIKYTIPLYVDDIDSSLWRDYICNIYNIENDSDLINFMNERKIIQEGGNWDKLFKIDNNQEEESCFQ